MLRTAKHSAYLGVRKPVTNEPANGHPIRMLTLVDEFARECLAIDVAKRLTSEDVLERMQGRG